ncbi:MAG: N-acetyl-gamma-glutamyl-phosphate reductase [Bdellovibrionales bacterium]|nr:N-acetyl-gamma-glutamyl-phosphate reductase [Bdellovibrionales bacterium]
MISSSSFQQKIQRVAIIGARGYSGLELTRLCWNHPSIEIKFVSASSRFDLSQYLHRSPQRDLPPVRENSDFSRSDFSQIDLVFLATPHEISWTVAPLALKAGAKVIDLSGAFRLKDELGRKSHELYKMWYGQSSEIVELANSSTSAYGLIPFHLYDIEKTQLVANPGCYATSILMALVPLLREKIIDSQNIVIDAKSGTTGAGRKAQETLLFSEVAEECWPYKIGTHQHQPEILQALNSLSDSSVDICMNTHLLNLRRGIISSLYLRPHSPSEDDNILRAIEATYSKHFQNYPLIRWGKAETHPQLLRLKRVVGTAFCHLSFEVIKEKIYLFSTLDNLLKGAAGQAIENFNYLNGLPLNTGLDQLEALA